MRNSFELAESCRHLTVKVENKWFSNLHKHVNSANPRNINVPTGFMLKERKNNLSLPKPLSLNDFCAQIAPHVFARQNPSLDRAPHLDPGWQGTDLK